MLKGVIPIRYWQRYKLLTINKNDMETINNSLKIRYVVIDTITDGEVTELYMFEPEAQAAIKVLEKNDKICGCYEKNSYKVTKVETI